MKSLAAALVAACIFLGITACSQSPQHLVEAGNRYHAKKKYQEASILYRKAIAKSRTYADAYYREGLNLLDQKNTAEAAKFFRRAVDLDAANTDAEIKLSEIYLTAYAYDQRKFRSLLPEVRDLTAKILARSPSDIHGIRLQAFLFLVDKNLPKAVESFEKANQIQPYSRDIVGWLAQALAANNQFDQAETLARGMITHDKTWGPAYDFLVVQYLQRNREQDAEAVLKERVANNPESDTALINYTNYLLQTGRYDQAEAGMRKVLENPKLFPTGHRLLGDFYMRAKRFDQAVRQYTVGSDTDAKNRESYQLRLVEAIAGQGASNPAKKLEALNLARKISESHANDGRANELYATLLLETGVKQDVTKSIGELKNLVGKNNTDAILHFDLARAYYFEKDPDKALAEAVEATRLRPSLFPARLVSASVYEDRGQHGKALDESGIVLAAAPGNAEARLIRIRALIGLKNFDKAQPELEALVKSNPAYGDAVYHLANLYMQRKDYAKAQDLFQELWEGIGPDAHPDLRGFVGLQEVKLHQGRWQEAVRSLEDLAQKNPNQASIRYTLANFQADAGLSLPTGNAERSTLLSNAEDNYRKVLKTSPNLSDTWMRLGTIQRLLNENEAALASFEEAGKANPSNAEAFMNRAMIFEILGQKDKARDAYVRTLGIDPDNAIALNNVAFMEAQNGQDLNEAMSYAEHAKKRFPNNPNVSDTLGYVYLQKNLTGDALRELEFAVKNDPRNSSFRLHLAMALLKSGDKAAARREAESALKMATSDQQEKIRSFLGQIG